MDKYLKIIHQFWSLSLPKYIHNYLLIIYICFRLSKSRRPYAWWFPYSATKERQSLIITRMRYSLRLPKTKDLSWFIQATNLMHVHTHAITHLEYGVASPGISGLVYRLCITIIIHFSNCVNPIIVYTNIKYTNWIPSNSPHEALKTTSCKIRDILINHLLFFSNLMIGSTNLIRMGMNV